MVRLSFCVALATVVLMINTVRADEAKKTDEAKDKKCTQATISKIDKNKNSVSVTVVDKNGKESEKTFQLSKDSKYLDGDGHDAKLDAFHSGDDVLVTENDNKVTELRKHAAAKIVKIDTKTDAITVQFTQADGKEIDKIFKLIEDAEYLDSTGRIVTLDVFRSGDNVLLIESDGKLTAMKKDKSDISQKTKDKSSNGK